ncbi:MAG: hypothetical protein SFV22_07890, partial [Saprospiraceae bacterium]|nr:hypothetical protein [Saprospiraceae bacterium]
MKLFLCRNHSLRLLIFFSFVSLTIHSQTPTGFSCGVNAEPSDYQEILNFLNAGNHVAGNLNSEISVPLHIIYVNKDNGTPSELGFKLSESVEIANQVFDGIVNVYICG